MPLQWRARHALLPLACLLAGGCTRAGFEPIPGKDGGGRGDARHVDAGSDGPAEDARSDGPAEDAGGADRWSNPGALDPGFGNTGQRAVDVPLPLARELSRVVSTVLGYSLISETYQPSLGRWLLGVQEVLAGGWTSTLNAVPFGEGDVQVADAVRTGDSGLYVVGTASNGFNQDVLLVQISSNGEHVQQSQLVPVGYDDDEGLLIAAPTPDRLLVGARFVDGALTRITVLAFHLDGTPDTDFGAGGRTDVSPPSAVEQQLCGLFPQADGTLVLLGDYQDSSGGSWYWLSRLDASGQRDFGLCANGYCVGRLPAGGLSCSAAAADASGGLVFLVDGDGVNYDDWLRALRLDLSGFSLDPDYGSAGSADVLDPASSAHGVRLAAAAGGKLVALSRANAGSGTFHGHMTRLDAAGRFDPAFAGTGQLTLDFGWVYTDLLVEDDGGMVVGGKSQAQEPRLVLERHLSSGLIDASFGSGGRVAIAAEGVSDDTADAVALAPDGDVVVAGTAIGAGFDSWFVRRLSPTGHPRSNIGEGGTRRVQTPGLREAASILAAGDHLYLAGTSMSRVTVLRLNADATPDLSFGDQGAARPYDLAAHTIGLGLSPQGRLLVGSYRVDGGNRSVVLHRLLEGGANDPAYAGGGLWLTGGTRFDSAAQMRVTSDGGAVVALTLLEAGPPQTMGLLRVRPDGTADSDFGDALGIVPIVPIVVDAQRSKGLAVAPMGVHVLLGGAVHNGVRWVMALARVQGDGSLRTNFGQGGVATFLFSEGDAEVRAVAWQADYKYLAAGWAMRGGKRVLALIRVLADGSLDPTFGAGGVVLDDFDGDEAEATDLRVQPDGGIVVVGAVRRGLLRDTLVARYQP